MALVLVLAVGFSAGLNRSEQKKALLPHAQPDLDGLKNLSHYKLDLSVDFAALTFSGALDLDFVNAEDVDLEQVYFRLFPNANKEFGGGSLEVSEVTVDKKSASTLLTYKNILISAFSQQDTILEVALPEPLPPGKRARIQMKFNGVVPKVDGLSPGENIGIFRFSQGVLTLAGWYPIVAVYDQDGWNLDPLWGASDAVFSDIALYSVDLKLSGNMIVAATGITKSCKEEEQSTQCRLVSGPARDFTLLISPDFQILNQEAGGTTINSYFLPGHENGGKQALSAAVYSLEAYNELFGPYPYTELDIVDAPLEYSGMEYPGLVIIATDLYTDLDNLFFTEVVAHEVAHQWWYGIVGNDVFEAPWQDEGLTIHSSRFGLQKIIGEQETTKYFEELGKPLEEAQEAGRDAPIAVSQQEMYNTNDISFMNLIIYEKADLFYQALHAKIGDEAFLGALQSYYQKYKYKIALPEDLLNEFEQAAGIPLDDFYQEWLYTASFGK